MIKNVPTNIITGALGAGKTTLIQTLLAKKPQQERWAVLVNEFGEIGIDGAIMEGESEPGVHIKEVPGGCMCCAAGLPMQFALNLLLAESKPHRLLIEPTGLGHPKEVMETLTQPHYKDVLDIKSTFTLIDVRKLADDRWRAHSTFQEQMQIADVVVVTKSDLYTAPFENALKAYMEEMQVAELPVINALTDDISLEQLNAPTKFGEKRQKESNTHHHHSSSPNILSTPKKGIVSARNQGQGFYSRGWICAPDITFDYLQCKALFQSLSVNRLKAVMITDNGVMSFNVSDQGYSEKRLKSTKDSRLEIIVDSEAQAEMAAAKIVSELVFFN